MGVDVGTFMVRAVALARRRGRLTLVGVGDAPLDPGPAPAHGGAQARAVAAVLEGAGCTRGPVIAGLPGPTALVRRVVVAPERRSDLPAAVARALEPQVPFALTEASVDWQVLEGGPTRPAGGLEVLAVAARRDRVAERVGLFDEAGRHPACLDADACALTNAVVANHPEVTDRTVALVHVGHTSTVVCICERGQPVVVRDVLVAGRRYLQGFDRDLGLGPAEALRRLRVEAAEADPGTADVVLAVNRQIAAEVARTLDAALPAGSHRLVQQVWVSGGASRAMGLVDALASTLGLPVAAFNPFAAVHGLEALASPPEWPPAFAVALGLALRGGRERS